ncbi:uncharacterized protein LOC129583693 isoform X2 [Paramacrobiotus metropolitanus]|uniref:uncharacterized protein LOC129583693 isoform X2 n=1 Tax=Paramacrobiotus metropolitanus TaxID=2943436 RepID=UPI0024465BCB|nr:uncharacterized protein LOC129583693 isoform X2 [Paramacrobiotus metropolitanus]
MLQKLRVPMRRTSTSYVRLCFTTTLWRFDLSAAPTRVTHLPPPRRHWQSLSEMLLATLDTPNYFHDCSERRTATSNLLRLSTILPIALFWNRFVVGIPKPAPIGKKRRPIIKKVQMGVVLIRCMDQDPRIDDFEGLTETGREVITVMVETTETTVAMVETRLLWKRSAIVSLPFSTIEIN